VRVRQTGGVAEVLGHDDTVEDVREELELGIELPDHAVRVGTFGSRVDRSI